jgi:PAS domain S-box-containing protein
MNNPHIPTHVLVVDDEKAIRTTFSAFLKREGYRVTECSSLSGTSAIIENTEIDVAVLDVDLGTDNGLDIADILKQKNSNIQLVIVTGHPEINSARRAIQLGVMDYLAKPVTKEQLLETCRRAKKEKQRADDYDLLMEKREAIRERLIREIQTNTEALHESEERYRSLVENLNDGIFEVSSDSTITYVSPAIKRILGYNPEELIGTSFRPLIYDEDMRIVDEDFMRVMQEDRLPLEFRMIHKSDDIRWVRTSSRRMADKNGNAKGIQGIISDITEQMLLKNEIKSLTST